MPKKESAVLFSGDRRVLYGAVAVLCLVAFAVLSGDGLYRGVYQFLSYMEPWRESRLLLLYIVLTFALIILSFIHARQLQAEMRQRHRAEKVAATAAHYDALTGIANRRLFQDRLKKHIVQASLEDEKLAVLVLDIDRFLTINEACGHGNGDHVLRRVAERLRQIMGHDDMVARLGDDEFALLVRGDEGDLFAAASRILNMMREPFACCEKNVQITVSIGISRYPGDGNSASKLLQCANVALSEAKAAGKDRYALYDRELDECRQRRHDAELELRGALGRREIVAYYQPLVDLTSHRIVGFEALARWQHPQRGLLGADEFIPVAEDNGLIGMVLTRMLERICEDARNWDPEIVIAVNLSSSQLLDQNLTHTILSILAEHDFPPHRLEIEVTETAFLADFDAARRAMTALKANGMRMSLDDFGTGYSGFRHLQELPFDKIKIDSSFTRRIASDPQCRKIITSMIGLGEALGLTTVAEGVEHPEEKQWLRFHHCKLGQGYLFAQPMSAEHAGLYIAEAAPAAEPAELPGRA
ncbi:putative bifunctional diguanylate cyclase/phosphodiesterase [Xanthobacter sp. TB0139]|uniref:putative bifunctional diguanylate cyclase/phosphodiesterase n=1 Tax=Xanthobacter sp. TB0139 TaxID=3459178 RepID=UPI004039691D